MTDLVNAVETMGKGIIQDESDVDPNEIGLCGDSQCGSDCSKCSEAVCNNV